MNNVLASSKSGCINVQFLIGRMHTMYRHMKTFIDNGQAITNQKILNKKIFLQVRSACNSLNFNQRNIYRALPAG